jgi:hypothetical protein
MAITVVGSTVVAGTSITIPTHQSGDVIVMFAHASTNGAQPSAPSAGGTVPTWNLLSTSGSTSWSNHRTAWALGTGSTTSGTWAGSTDMLMVIVLRGADTTTPIGGRASGAVGIGASCTAPAVTLTHSDGTSLLMHFHSWGDGVNNVGTISAVPTGYTRQVGTVASVRLTGVINTKTVSTTSPSIAQSISGSTYNSGATIEVLEAAAGSTTTLTPAGASVAITGTAPTLVRTTVLNPAAASATVTGTAPTLDIIVTPPGGSLTGALITVTGSAPTLTTSLVTTGNTITITGGTPSTAGTSVLTPAAASVTVTGTAPTLLVSIVPGSETLPVTGGTPVLITTTVLSPAAAPISVTGGTPVVILRIALQPSAASITVTGLNPTITVGIVVAPAPDEDHLLLVRREKRTLLLEGSRTHLMGRFKQVVDA